MSNTDNTNNKSQNTSTINSPFLNGVESTGYVYFNMDSFGDSNTLLVEINQYPHNVPIYWVPKDLSINDALMSNNASKYLLKPANAGSNDNGLYLLVNKSLTSIWPKLAWWGKNVYPFEVPSGISAGSTANYQLTADFSDGRIVMINNNVLVNNVTPTSATIPFITVEGRPIISIEEYLSYFPLLSQFSLSSYPSNYNLSQNVWTLEGSDVPTGLSVQTLNTLISQYRDALQWMKKSMEATEPEGIKNFANRAKLFTARMLSYFESAAESASMASNNGSISYIIKSANSTMTWEKINQNQDPWLLNYMSVYINHDSDQPDNFGIISQGNYDVNWNHDMLYQYVQSGWNQPYWSLKYSNIQPGSSSNFYLNNSGYGSFQIANSSFDLAQYATPITNCNWVNAVPCWQHYSTTATNTQLPGNFISGSMNLGPVQDQHWYIADDGVVMISGFVPTWQLQVNGPTQPFWVTTDDGSTFMKSNFIQFPALATSTSLNPCVDIGFEATGVMTNGLSYISLQNYYSNVAWHSLNYYQSTIQAQYPSATVTLPILEITVSSVTTKITVPDDEGDLEKLSDNYYSTADLLVAGYYNSLLQKDHYILTNVNQSGKATPLQIILAIAEKFDYTGTLITEWVNGHPFQHVPETTRSLQFAANNGLSPLDPNFIDDNTMLAAIDQFFTTVIPGSVNALSISPDNTSSLSNAYTQFLTTSGDSSSILLNNAEIPVLMPSVFRQCMIKVMGMGAILHNYHSFFSLLKLHQTALQSEGFTDASGAGTLPSLNNQTSNSTSVAESSLSLDKARFDMEQHVSSNLKPMIYPLFDDVINDIQDEIQGIRYLTEGRLHGMSFELYQPEIKSMLTHRIKITHEFIHLFMKAAHTALDIVNDINSIGSYLNSKLAKPIDTLFLKPLTHVFVAIVKFAASAILDMTHLVSPGSEILTIAADTNIIRPLPFPLSPWGSQGLFTNVVVNGSNTSNALDFSQIDCLIPFVGLANRSSSNCGYTVYDPLSNDYTVYVPDPNGSVNEDIPTMSNGNLPYIAIAHLTRGLHCFRMITTAGSVRMWVSPDLQYSSSSTTGFSVNPQFSVPSEGQYTTPTYVCSNSFMCFVPDPVVDLDERISLPKTFHKWIITGLALPGLFYKGSQISSYHTALEALSTIPGFTNLTTHVSTSSFAIACTADAAASTYALSDGILSLIDGQGFKSSAENFAIGAEDLLNIASITSIYLKANSENVLNAWYSNSTTIQSTLANVWPTDTSSKYSTKFYTLFNHHVVNDIDQNVPAWYGESWGRVLGDVMLGVAKIAYFLHVQHKAFKKWTQASTPDQKNKTSVFALLKTKIMNKYQRHKTVVGVTDAMKKLNHSFSDKPNIAGLHTYELSSSKNIRSILNDDTNIVSLIKQIGESSGGWGID